MPIPVPPLDARTASGVYDPTNFLIEPAGTIARNVPRNLISNGAVTGTSTAGAVVCAGIELPAGLIVTNIEVLTGTTAVSGQTQQWMGILDPFANVLATTAAQGSTSVGASAPLKLALLTPLTILYTAVYYVAFSSTASTTAPTLSGGPALVSGVASTGLGTPVVCGTAGTQSALPAVGTQLNGGVITAGGASNFAVWLS